jgi:hypothetical protein
MDMRTKRIEMILAVPLPRPTHGKTAYPPPELVCDGLFEQITPILRNC